MWGTTQWEELKIVLLYSPIESDIVMHDNNLFRAIINKRWNCQFARFCLPLCNETDSVFGPKNDRLVMPTYSIYFHLFILLLWSGHVFVTRSALIMTEKKTLLFDSMRYKDTWRRQAHIQIHARTHKHTEDWFHLTWYCTFFFFFPLVFVTTVQLNTPLQFPPLFIHHIIRSNYC